MIFCMCLGGMFFFCVFMNLNFFLLLYCFELSCIYFFVCLLSCVFVGSMVYEGVIEGGGLGGVILLVFGVMIGVVFVLLLLFVFGGVGLLLWFYIFCLLLYMIMFIYIYKKILGDFW